MACNEQAQVARKRELRIAARREVLCETCGESLADRRATRFCSKRCCDISRGKVRAEPFEARVCQLSSCGKPYAPSVPHQRCCCHAHVVQLWRLQNVDKVKASKKWNDKRRDAYHRRRALKKGASTGRPVNLAEIAKRDAWRCHLCSGRVSRNTIYPDPRSASLDHVIPLSLGGDHDPANVRLAHLVCNVAKGNRSAGDQLLLFA